MSSEYPAAFNQLRWLMDCSKTREICLSIVEFDLSCVDFELCVEAARSVWTDYFDQNQLVESILRSDEKSTAYCKNLRKRLLILGSVMGFCCNPSTFPPNYHAVVVALGNYNDGILERDVFLDLVQKVILDFHTLQTETIEKTRILGRIRDHITFISAIMKCNVLDLSTFHFLRKKIRDLKNLLQMIYISNNAATVLSIICLAEKISHQLGEQKTLATTSGIGTMMIEEKTKEDIDQLLSCLGKDWGGSVANSEK